MFCRHCAAKMAEEADAAALENAEAGDAEEQAHDEEGFLDDLEDEYDDQEDVDVQDFGEPLDGNAGAYAAEDAVAGAGNASDDLGEDVHQEFVEDVASGGKQPAAAPASGAEAVAAGGDTKGGTAQPPSAGVAASTAPQNGAAKPQQQGRGREGRDAQEWELAGDNPDLRPCPLLKVTQVKLLAGQSEASSCEALRAAIEAAGVVVRSVALEHDANPGQGTGRLRTAYVRLPPPPLPWAQNGSGSGGGSSNNAQRAEEGSTDGKPKAGGKKRGRTVTDVHTLSESAVRRLGEAKPRPAVNGQELAFEGGSFRVTLFIGNLTPEWTDVERLRSAMAAHGSVERAAVLGNAQGVSKGYAIVEYTLPSGAGRGKAAVDMIENEMRPDSKKAKEAGATGEGKGPGAWARWEQVKLQRAEWTMPRTVPGHFSRVLYLSNLKPGFRSNDELKVVFEGFGPVTDAHIPTNRATGVAKGFGFVEFKRSNHADAALRATDGVDHSVLGRVLVSFANPAKLDAQRAKATPRAAGGAAGGMAQGGTARANAPGGRTMRDAAGRPMAAGRAGTFGGPMGVPLGGRGMLGGRGLRPMLVGGRGLGAPLGFPPVDPAALRLQQQMALQQQAGQQMAQVAFQRQLQAQMQAQMRQQQAALQAQLRAAQAQAQAAALQAQQYQRAATQAQAKAAAEAEARRRAEEEARKAAARAASVRPDAAAMRQAYTGFMGAGSGDMAGTGYGASAGGYDTGYGTAAGAQTGYGGSGAAGAQASYDTGTGAGGYGAYSASDYATQGYDTAGGYGATQGSGYSAAAAGFGAGAGYGQLSKGYASGTAGVGQKRDASYTANASYSANQSAYGNYGAGYGQEGSGTKRARY
ncbi:hypothetical protein WJX81_006763 [Elliptochloris bilobata]|uniref:RRM domain-containing protein n=1 Tax=Elliptochloris bilobata TaxID=381761 RepID=A0AAW1SJT2_9CHLO